MALATIEETGLHLPDYPTVLEDVKARFRGIYGDDLYLGPDSQDGQLCAVFALALHDAYTLAGSVYNAYSPATAQGTGLSRMVKINGLRRKPSGGAGLREGLEPAGGIARGLPALGLPDYRHAATLARLHVAVRRKLAERPAHGGVAASEARAELGLRGQKALERVGAGANLVAKGLIDGGVDGTGHVLLPA